MVYITLNQLWKKNWKADDIPVSFYLHLIVWYSHDILHATTSPREVVTVW